MKRPFWPRPWSCCWAEAGAARPRQPSRALSRWLLRPFVSVASRVVHVLRSIVTGRVASLRGLFNRGGSRSQTVATFLAVLELIRAGRIEIDDQETLTVRRGRMKKQES